jgi:hypothetical protein
MSVLRDELDLNGLAHASDVNWIKDTIASAFWTWYAVHKEDKLVRFKKLLFLSFTVRVRHLEPVFELLFGQNV